VSAVPHLAFAVDPDAGSAVRGLLSHLDAVYVFAHALTCDDRLASDLTEHVYRGVTRELWSTLGGHGLRDRLLARCLTIFNEGFRARRRAVSVPPEHDAVGLLRDLSVEQRAAVALVDRLGLRYDAAAVVLGVSRDAFRTLLHDARNTLVTRHASGIAR
jgi:predicted DNA-binding protein (UPF0251 family)